MNWPDTVKNAKIKLLNRLDELAQTGHGEIVVKVSKSAGKISIRKSEDEQIEE